MIRFYDFTNQGESKITEHLAPIQTELYKSNKCYKVYIKYYIKFKTHSRQKKEKTHVDDTLVFQKNLYKIQTYINPF